MAGVGIRWCDGRGQCAGPGEATPEPTRVNGSHETTRSSYGDIRSHRSGCCGVGACVVGRGLVERVTGIEPAFSAWEADVLPLNYTRQCFREGSNAEHVTSTCFSGPQHVH